MGKSYLVNGAELCRMRRVSLLNTPPMANSFISPERSILSAIGNASSVPSMIS